MKTYDSKNITKRHIDETLRTMDSTQIYRLVHRVCGCADKSSVFLFIKTHASTNKVSNAALDIAFSKKHQVSLDPNAGFKYAAFCRDNAKHIAMTALRDFIYNRTEYSKRPVSDGKDLLLCSPAYGLRDYNMSRVMPVSGNERFCETIIKLADKYDENIK